MGSRPQVLNHYSSRKLCAEHSARHWRCKVVQSRQCLCLHWWGEEGESRIDRKKPIGNHNWVKYYGSTLRGKERDISGSSNKIEQVKRSLGGLPCISPASPRSKPPLHLTFNSVHLSTTYLAFPISSHVLSITFSYLHNEIMN